MIYFDFNSLIEKYSCDFTVISEAGNYDDSGEWEGQTTESTMHGAIIGLSESKIHRSEGTLSAQDKILYMALPVPDALMGATVIHNGKKYRIEGQNGSDNAEYTGVYAYTLKCVSAFMPEQTGGGTK